MKIVGVTSCPAGLAHTPMAAKALENAGKQLGHEIKIEQQGIMGQVNGITAEEAKQADLCIIASNQRHQRCGTFLRHSHSSCRDWTRIKKCRANHHKSCSTC